MTVEAPNQALVWAKAGYALAVRDGEVTKPLRQWGYVFWDKARLDRWANPGGDGDLEAAIQRWYVWDDPYFGEWCFSPFGVEGTEHSWPSEDD
ncbi:MAG: hypothetical protein M1832_000484 [Thelocarpon impressellum]|nr:MAG: hypothetical protein M1832_000484 [Thelocarpon impressellum]